MQSIINLVKTRENTYVNGNTEISKYVSYSQYQTINTIEAYINSKHISGEVDALGREKPFFNIVTAASNIWMRATDIDRKNIKFKATKRKYVIPAFIANIVLQDWMKKADYGSYLNEWGRVLARCGSAVSKFVDRDGDLFINVVPWNKIISDDIDFESNVKIIKFYATPAQLKENPTYNQAVVKSLLESTKTRELIGGQTVDVLADYIELYEVQGYLPVSMLTGNEKDEDTYAEQIHIISVDAKDNGTLYSGKLKKCQLHKADLIKEDGRALGIGAVEHLFQAQWMVNHSTKLAKDQIDLISKVFFQTADTNYAGRNALSNIENGDIMIHAPNAPLTQVNNNSHDLTSLQSYLAQWQNQAREITSTPDAISGNTMPSGTAYRQVAILNQESHSLFELMTENKGLAIEQTMREYIIPHIKSKLSNKEEITAILDSQGVKQLDTWYITAEAQKRVNKKIVETVLTGDEGTVVTPDQQAEMMQAETDKLQQELSTLGNQRFLKPSELDDKTWRDIFEGFDWEVEVEVTNEQSDKEAVMTTLTTVLQTIAANPAVLENETMKTLLSKIIETTGVISSVEISQSMNAPQSPAPQAIGGE